MHQGHDHDHHHHGNGASAGHNHAQPRGAVQWQTPHLPHGHEHKQEQGEPDLDLVEAAFVQAFATATDPTSFLRLARIPFESEDAEGKKLVMLRVETESVTDVGSVTPQLGGGALRYDPLPAKMVAQRRRLRFVYFDGQALRPLTLGETRTLRDINDQETPGGA